MVVKVLRRSEVLKGFIQIPKESKLELIGNYPLPHPATVNGNPARIDSLGRLWSKYLKNRFSINSSVELKKTKNGYLVSPVGSERGGVSLPQPQQNVNAPGKSDLEKKAEVFYRLLQGDCIQYLNNGSVANFHLTFLDPPYRQGKDYRFFDDSQPASKYWGWLKEILHKVYEATVDGGAIYFMQREKNAGQVLRVLRKTGWRFQNLIVWKKKTSAVPIHFAFSKQYQIIAYATKGDRPRVFNKLRINPPPLPEHRYEHENGVYLTDVWDDIRELTSGYFAGDEAIRDAQGNRIHIQQSPVALLLRIILSSTLPGDTVFDPLAGTGTALVVADQLRRSSIGIEIDPNYVEIIRKRLNYPRTSDNVSQYYDYYRFTPNLKEIWPLKRVPTEQRSLF
jgi:site-specific DNA-methyltransferase (adenine-specific)